jgi:hypothetical protein
MPGYRVTFRLKRPVPDVPGGIVYVQNFPDEGASFVDAPPWEWLRRHKAAFEDKEVLSVERVP